MNKHRKPDTGGALRRPPHVPPVAIGVADPDEVLPCVGCGEKPINTGNMGRYKYVCPTYQSRNRKRVTPKCDGGQTRSMWKHDADAIIDWNDVQLAHGTTL